MMLKTDNTKPFYRTTIPADWEVKKLNDCLDLLTDFEANGSFADVKANVKVYDESGYAWYVRATDLENGSDLKCVKYVDETTYNFLKKTKLNGGEVLITKRGEIGKVYLFEKMTEYATVAPNLYLLKLNKKAHPYFIYSYFIAEIGNRELRKIDSSSTIGALYKDDVKALKIPLPPISEQRAIAHVLGLMDFAINQNNQLIAQKELRKKWLMQNLLTGKKRLNGFGGEWKEVAMSNVFNRVTRKNTEENTNVVTISAQRGFVRQTDFFNKSIASEIIDNYFLVEKGEFCYNKSYSNGYPWGATKRLNDFDKAVVTTLYICFGIKDLSKTSGDFFEQYFEANILDRGLTKIAHEGGRAHGLLNVTPSDFFSLKITIPSFEEQSAISQVLQAADKEIQLLKAKTDKLREQKKGMMQVLLTGKKRLNLDLQD